jgi:predicted Zn-dependent protease
VIRAAVLVLVLAWVAGCKDPEQQNQEIKQRSATDSIARGRTALAEGKSEDAVKFFKEAANNQPGDPMIYLLLAQAEKADGNDTAAVLAIKQAEENGAKNDPSVKRERAELYRRMGQTKEAIETLKELRDDKRLTDGEVLLLAQLQAHSGDSEGAY